jgi:UDP-N-acetylmuramate dehydrogenase
LRKRVFRDQNTIKIPAAFLLEICELKNLQVGGARINQNQPLVIINESGKASAKDVLALVKQVRIAVFEKTGLKLAHEPELIGFSTEEIAEAVS